MVELHTLMKEAEFLEKERENEVNWLKIHNIFEKLDRFANTKEDVLIILGKTKGLLLLSIQSERSRLNGVALNFLKKCVNICTTSYDFSPFLSVLFKLTGKANRLAVSRSTDALMLVGMHVGKKALQKQLSSVLVSNNKNTRFAAYKLVDMRTNDLMPQASQWIESALKDPAQEVRAIFKSKSGMPKAKEVISKEITKIVAQTSITKPPTPRKQLKVEERHEEKIKTLEREINKIATYAATKSSTVTFYEKLNKLKEEKPWNALSADQLTPRRLDKYLEKFRNPSEVPFGGLKKVNESLTATRISEEPKEVLLKNSVLMVNEEVKENTCITQEPPKADLESLSEVENISLSSGCIRIEKNSEHAESEPLKENESQKDDYKDAGSVAEISIVHEHLPNSLFRDQIASEEESSLTEYNHRDDEEQSPSVDEVENLSKSLINITIEPSFINNEDKKDMLTNDSLEADYKNEENPQTSILCIKNDENAINTTVILGNAVADQSFLKAEIDTTDEHRILNKEVFENVDLINDKKENPIFEL